MALGRTGNWLLLKQRCYAPSLPVEPLPSHSPFAPYPDDNDPSVNYVPTQAGMVEKLENFISSIVRAWRKKQKGSILPLSLLSHLFQVREGELEVYPQSLVLRLWEFVQLVLIFHGNSFQWHWTKLYYNKKETEDRLICYFTRSQVGTDCLVTAPKISDKKAGRRWCWCNQREPTRWTKIENMDRRIKW